MRIYHAFVHVCAKTTSARAERATTAAPAHAHAVRTGGGATEAPPCNRREGEVLLRGVGTLRYLLILGESPAGQVPIYAVAA